MRVLAGRLRIAATALVFFGLATPCLAGVACIPASRYSTIAAITMGDMTRLARGLGGRGLPPSDACRAALISGPLDDAAVTSLLDLVRQNRGWLAHLYLAFEDRDVGAEARLAQAVRMFRLSSTLMLTDLDYTPDFLTETERLPASVSYAWRESDRTTASGVDERLGDYLKTTDRRIARGVDRCGFGCATALAASVDRHQLGLVKAMREARETPPQEGQAADARAQDMLRRHFGIETRPVRRPYGLVSGAFPRFPPEQKQVIEKDCRSRIDYAASRRAELVKQVDGFAGHDFPNMNLNRLLPVVRAVREAAKGAEQCAAQVLDRGRLVAFAKACGKGCSTQDLRQAIDAEVAAFYPEGRSSR